MYRTRKPMDMSANSRRFVSVAVRRGINFDNIREGEHIPLSNLPVAALADAINALSPHIDDQQLSLAGNVLSITGDNPSVVDLTQFLDNSDDQVLSASLTGTQLTIAIEDGGTKVIELASINTDDQTLTLAGTNLSIEDGNVIDLAPFLDNTDDQQISSFNIAGNTLSLVLEDGGNGSVDLTGYDQDIAQFDIAGNVLTLDLANGGSATVDLAPYLDNVDNQQITAFSLTGTTLTLALDGNVMKNVDLSALLDNTDNQQLSLASNILAIEDGGQVDLSGYLDNTDAQTIDTFSITGNTLTLEILNGGTATVDLSAYLDNSDDQKLTDVSLTGTTLSITLEDGGTKSVDLSAFMDDTDDQTLSLTGNLLTIADGNTVDLTFLMNTDNQQVQTFAISANELSLLLEDGGTVKTVDLSPYLDNTDDQVLSLVGTNLVLEDGGTPIDLSPLLDNTDEQTLSVAGQNLSISGGNSVPLPPPLVENDLGIVAGKVATGFPLVRDTTTSGAFYRHFANVKAGSAIPAGEGLLFGVNRSILSGYWLAGDIGSGSINVGYDNKQLSNYSGVIGSHNDIDADSGTVFVTGSGHKVIKAGGSSISGNLNIVENCARSIIAGDKNEATSSHYTAVTGRLNKATGSYLSLSGSTCTNTAGSYNIIAGYKLTNSASSYNALFGYSSTTKGFGNLIAGYSHIVDGNRGFTAGSGNTNAGVGTCVIGFNHKVKGHYSFTCNSGNVVDGNYSAAIGHSNTNTHHHCKQLGASLTSKNASSVQVAGASEKLGFHNVTPVTRASHPATLAQVITILTNLGLCQ